MALPLLPLLLAHSAISLLAIPAGLVVVAGLLRGRDRVRMATVFLLLAFVTSASGFLFPFFALLPSHVIGVAALLVLALLLPARRRLAASAGWRRIYALGMVASLYFIVFVAIAQGFDKIPALHALAPTQSAPAFRMAQGAMLVLFIILGTLALRRAATPFLSSSRR